MARTAQPKPNEVLILEARLAQRKDETHPSSTPDEFFLTSSIDTVLRGRGLSYQQIEAGITEGADDGGIDAVYTFINGRLVEDDNEPVNSERCLIELELIQAKNESGFKEVAIQKLIDHLPLLLQLDTAPGLETEFNDRLLERFAIFRAAYLRASAFFPDLTIRVRYATKSVDEAHIKVAKKGDRLTARVREVHRDAIVELDLIGAADLNSRARQRLTKILDLRVSEQPLSAEKGGLVCLVTLTEWNNFIRDADGHLREEIFEENVRGYAGTTRINRAIADSLKQGDAGVADFWWLNNGVTVLGKRVKSHYKNLTIDDPQIVNGLQTSRTIYQHFRGTTNGSGSGEGEGRHLLVRVIEASDDTVSSQIIKATNSQNQVSTASLRATEPFQRSIEEFFSQNDYFYERKKNEYKNQGKPRDRIVEVLELAQATAAMILCEPHISRGQPSTLVRDPQYGKVFSSKVPFKAFLNCVLIVRRVDEFLERAHPELNRQGRGNIRYQLARAATAFALNSSRPRPVAIAKLVPDEFDTDRLEPIYMWVSEARSAAEQLAGTADPNVLAKSAEWTREIDRRLSYYTDKTRWPKQIIAAWST